MGASKQAMMDEVDRIGREEYDEDGNPKTLGYEDLDEMSGIPSRDTSAEDEEKKKLGGRLSDTNAVGLRNEEKDNG
jgi:hypothetical protein